MKIRGFLLYIYNTFKQNNMVKVKQKQQLLTFIKDVGISKNQKFTALYRCQCGTEVIYEKTEVRCGRKTACGCQRYGENNIGGYKHGFGDHPLYDVWKMMIKRCELPTDKSYHNYGGRGITVCAEWHDIKVFIEWATNNGYQEGLDLDRRENDGNYTPDNCRFIPHKKNCNNKRDNMYITYKERTQTLQEWAEEMKLKPHTLRSRIINYKWSTERALNTAV